VRFLSKKTRCFLWKNINSTGSTGRSIKDTFHKVEFFPDYGMWGITDKAPEEKTLVQKKETPDNTGTGSGKRTKYGLNNG